MLPDYATHEGAIGLDWYAVDPNLRLLLDRLLPEAGDRAFAEEHIGIYGELCGGPLARRAEVTRFLGRASQRLRDLVENLEELVPPDVIVSDVNDLLGLLGDYADGLDELGSNVKSGQTLQGALNESSGLVERLNQYATDVFDVVARLGLTGCVLTT